MKERSRERRAELLLEELFEQLAERENVKQMLVDLTALPIDEVVESLIKDFEIIIARRQVEALRAIVARNEKRPQPDQPVEAKAPEEIVPPAPQPNVEPTPVPVQVSPQVTTPLEPPPAPQVEQKPPQPAPVEAPRPSPPVAKSEPEKKPPAFWEKMEEEIRVGIIKDRDKSTPVHVPEKIEPEPEEEEEELPETVEAPSSEQLRSPCKFTDDDLVYIHAVTMIPENDPPSPNPFMLEEKGIDSKEFAFAFDHDGMRFYLSRVPSSFSVSKVGVLLLSKQESLEMRGVHESILNDLRLHGIVLPFDFGTLARGRDALLGRIEKHRDKLLDALDTMMATKWWTVSLFVLDAKMSQLVGKDETQVSRRTNERASYSKVPATKKYDIKLLERMLSKEKKIAESVHEELKKVVVRSDVDMMVSLGSGSSEDWKQILKASYEAPAGQSGNLFRAITDLQYHYVMFDLMLSVSGDSVSFGFVHK